MHNMRILGPITANCSGPSAVRALTGKRDAFASMCVSVCNVCNVHVVQYTLHSVLINVRSCVRIGAHTSDLRNVRCARGRLNDSKAIMATLSICAVYVYSPYVNICVYSSA